MAGLAAGAAASAPACAAPAADWPGFRRRFLQADGRVVDIGNGGISHSEGQGTGLLLAAAAGDRESFARIWSWTAVTLRRTQDELFAWRYEPQRGVSDHNNATDGDLLIAWALLRAGRAWREPAYVAAAKATAAAVRKRLIVEHAGGQLLLPGLQGFQAQDGSVVVNPSYLVLPAFAAFARAGFDGDGAAFAARSARFLREVRFGPYDLPIDWVRVDPVGAIWAEAARPPRFGFDAVCAPLYLMWAGPGGEPAVHLGRGIAKH